MRDLSVLIPSRQEPFLRHTIEDVLAASEADTEIIAICDGALPVEPIEDNPRVKLVLLPKSIGQRAATNMAARMSRAKYILKLDAHCRVDRGFDAKLIQDAQPDWMLIPLMYNLHVFDWVCDACGYRSYQGPMPTQCLCCKESKGFTQVMVWEPRLNRRTESYRFDNTLHFNYWRELMRRPEIRAQGEIHDTLSFLGACQFMERDYFWKLGGCDLRHGGKTGWGQWATEWACKVWLSGGRVAVTQRTWFSHLFRTQGPNFSFPYPMSGRDQENARKHSREMWFSNKWEGQRYPLAWLIKHFWPIPGWEESDLSRLVDTAVSFRVVLPLTDRTTTTAQPKIPNGELVPSDAVGSTGLLSAGTLTAQDVLTGWHKAEVNRITAPGIATGKVVDHQAVSVAGAGQWTNQPSVENPVNSLLRPVVSNTTVPKAIAVASPKPAAGVGVNADLRKNSSDLSCGKMIDGEQFSSHDSASLQVESRLGPEKSSTLSGSHIIPHKKPGIIYYTDALLADPIYEACQRQLARAAGDIPIVSVSLGKGIDFGDNIIIERQRGAKTLFLQIIAGLERSTADYVFFCEHDVLYPKEHFDFVPPRDDVFYYDVSLYKLSAATGKSVTYQAKQLSGLCANRLLLLEHYYRRLARMALTTRQVKAEGRELPPKWPDGHSRFTGWEPGANSRPGHEIDQYKSETWQSAVPYVDIREHGTNWTPTRWNYSQFRDKSTCKGWRKATEIPYWGTPTGRFNEFLAELTR